MILNNFEKIVFFFNQIRKFNATRIRFSNVFQFKNKFEKNGFLYLQKFKFLNVIFYIFAKLICQI